MKDVQQELFGRVTAEIHAHVSWNPVDGWSVWINSRLDGLPFDSSTSEGYERMVLDELLQVLEAELGTRYYDGRRVR